MHFFLLFTVAHFLRMNVHVNIQFKVVISRTYVQEAMKFI
jgi:hypothetical protein